MNQMRRLIFVFSLFATMTLSGCALQQMVRMANQQDVQVQPRPLEVHGDTVSFDVTAVLPQRMLRKNFEYELDFKYQHNGQEVDVNNITFNSTEYSRTDQPRKSQRLSFPYSDNVGNGNLVVQGIGRNPSNNRTRRSSEMPVAEGLITTSRLVKDAVFASYADHGYNTGEELEPVVLDFFFQQGRSNLRNSEITSDRGKELQAFVAAKNVTRTVTITGTHSPEGPERVNERLSENRARVIENWYRNMMQRYDYRDAASDIGFILKPVVEDWTLFREKMQNYTGITQEQKQQYLNIINGPGSFEDKERRLTALPNYRRVFADLYPELRRARTEILKAKVKRPESEIAVMSRQIGQGRTNVDALAPNELAYGATLTPDLDEKEAIYRALVKRTDSWMAHNNLGAVYLQKALNARGTAQANQLMQQAITHFETSNKKQNNAAAFTNLAIVYMVQGNNQRALETARKADGLTATTDNLQGLAAVRGTLQIKRGQYREAVQSLSNAPQSSDNLFNLGLAYLLNRDYQNAITSFDEAIELNRQNAAAYYGKAVAAARMNNASNVYENLRRAASIEPQYRQRAMGDLTFQSYAGTDQFRQALQ
jgi:tetratricopeptide (TPR) repeat protein